MVASPKNAEGVGKSGAVTLPRHIAFIMDGNGRWARNRGFPRLRGHQKGADALRDITRHCRSLGIPELTFFALSTENFQRRPPREVRFLMRLLKSYVISERSELMENGIRLKCIGHLEHFPEDVQEALRETQRLTAGHDKMVLRLALNYGGRQDILDAVRGVIRDLSAGRLTAEQALQLDERRFRRYLSEPDMSDPDLLIRTAGEFRMSNFLLWQCSYTEIWVTAKLWPDFDVRGLEEALQHYATRERKYGAIQAAGTTAASDADPPVPGESAESLEDGGVRSMEPDGNLERRTR